MTIKNIYVADDGEEFESEEECLEHEKMMNPTGAVLLFDSNLNLISVNEDLFGFENAIYIKILDSEKATQWFDWIYDQSSYTVPRKFTNGEILYYDEDEYVYESLTNDLASLQKAYDVIQSFKGEVNGDI